MPARFAALLFAFLAPLSCTSFPAIEPGECGNQVLDAGEDCDTFVPKSLPGGECLPRGGPDECRFDCSRNADGKRKPCPSGMGCTPDGVCRRVDEGFQWVGRVSNDVGFSLDVLDFDADGHREVLSTDAPDRLSYARFSLHYFDDDANLVETRRFPRVTSRPLPRDLNGDGRTDLVLSNGRIGMLPGRADREWVPATFSSYVLEGPELHVVPVSTAFVSDSFALVAITTIEDTPGLYVPNGRGALTFTRRLGGAFSRMLTPAAADLIEGRDSPCDEVVLAFRGQRSCAILDVCEISEQETDWNLAWRATPREQTVRLPGDATLAAPPVAADVDGDGHLDLLLSDGVRAYLARGDGARLEPEATPLRVPVVPEGFAELGTLLAAGDVTGDGIADFVLPRGVLGSRRSLVDDSIGYVPFSANSGEDWTLAQVVDLNGNGRPDVVAAHAGSPGITFLSSSATFFQVESRIDTAGPVRLLAAGDYDGDGINDLAFVQGGRPDEPRDTLAIAYGTRDRPPAPPVRLAELDGVRQLGSQHDGAFDDVFTASTTRSAETANSTFTLFDGNPDRLPLAPYTLNNFSTDRRLRDWQALGIIVGAFSARDATDVVALGVGEVNPGEVAAWTQWLIPSFGSSKLLPRELKNPDRLPGNVWSAAAGESVPKVRLAGVAADLEGDGFDEALWLMPSSEADSSCVLLIYEIDGDSGSTNLGRQLDLREACPEPVLSALDLNQDGSIDLALRLGEAPHRRLAMLWNDGRGQFSLVDRTYLEVEGEDIRSFTYLPPPGIELALVTRDHLYFAKTREDMRQFEVIEPGERLREGRAVVAADLNGDSITELLVADATGLSLWKAKLK